MIFSNTQKLTDFNDRHKSTPAVIVGSAHDISSFPYDTFSGLVFGMGDSPLRGVKLFKTDYWVFANCHWIRPWIQRDSAAIKLISPRATFVATSIFSYQAPSSIVSKLARSFGNVGDSLVFFDQRHFENLHTCKAVRGCCVAKSLLGIEDTVQELVSTKFKQLTCYSEGATVALHTLALAILMGCNPISIIGVKIPTLKIDYSYFQSHESDKLVKAFGSFGPYLESDLDYYAHLVWTIKTFAKSSGKGLRRICFPVFPFRLANDKPSIFSPDRVQIKADFEFIISNFLQKGGKILNYSKHSLLSEIKGVSDI